ncbi:hypothetical protein LEP1GSC199_3891 [Leptospira vanthielii serovar Holland str. Waz Holland = ATCC 700522]|uniref:Uncharacterized protein n=1 Tax=Leptospira vanthielii serovar Holland str. Waz Holland = ATCC 700522 TaxID=1218591 RepID=N1VVN4_9LEPT|nr:hypothetical protein LEP1GSC199_3891 [Leptospira vanthielii serovar Holland str. Waz Holland = ATCC 700522]
MTKTVCLFFEQINHFLIIITDILPISAEKTTFAYRLSMNRTRFLGSAGNSCS